MPDATHPTATICPCCKAQRRVRNQALRVTEDGDVFWFGLCVPCTRRVQAKGLVRVIARYDAAVNAFEQHRAEGGPLESAIELACAVDAAYHDAKGRQYVALGLLAA